MHALVGPERTMEVDGACAATGRSDNRRRRAQVTRRREEDG